MDKRRMTALFAGIATLAALGFVAAGCSHDDATDTSASPAASTAAPAGAVSPGAVSTPGAGPAGAPAPPGPATK